MVKILLLQGANLTFLGRREPEIYGSTTPADLDAMPRCHAHDHAYQLEIFYTNIEGEAINRIYQAVDEGFDGLVMNPAGFTYAGFSLKDCSRERVCRTWKCTSAVLRSATSTVSCPMWPKELLPASGFTPTFWASTRC